MIYLQTAFDKFEPTINHYPDGTYKIELPQRLLHIIRNGTLSMIDLVWKYGSESELPAVLYIANMIKDKFPDEKLNLVMPYIPNARMDRTHNEWECFTLKYFCNLINSIGFTKVVVLDAHSNVSTALLDHCINIEPTDYIKNAMERSNFDEERDLLLFPDEGACKRYAGRFRDVKYIAFGTKTRDWSTGVISNIRINCDDYIADENHSGRVFIIDDICARGGTVYHTIEALRSVIPNMKVNVFFTHCENSIASGNLLTHELIENIFTTDSICTLPTENSKLSIMSFMTVYPSKYNW